jgi:Nuclease-related domain.
VFFTGERVVGEELNQFLASGFRVFHDVPFEGFNIDHVLVGPPGIYAVETKTRRKPSDLKGTAKANVVFDGSALHFPKYRDTRSLEQARRNARTLAEWLTSATGERLEVHAVLTLPGWFVDRRAKSDVNVLNPDEIKRSFPSRPRQPLSPEQIQRIAHQLTERCRITKGA